MEELKGQHAMLRECIEQLTSIVTYLKDAPVEEEYKLDQVHNHLQPSQLHSEQAGNICRQLLSCDNNNQVLAKQDCNENLLPLGPHDFVSGSKEQSAPLMYTQQVSFAENSGHMGEDPKSAAAAVAAKLTASSSSAQMLTFVLSSLASEGVIEDPVKESSSDCLCEKRPKLENDHFSYVPSQTPESFQQNIRVVTPDAT